MPEVSVLMTSYNYGRFISEAIESVLGQKGLTDLELLIIDDGSSDNSREIISNYAAKDGRIRTIFHDMNRGIAFSMNEAITESRAGLIVLMSSDDRLKENTVAELARRMEKSPELGVAIYDGDCMDIEGRPLGYTYSEIHRDGRIREGLDLFRELLRGMFIQGGMLRKSMLREHGITLDGRLRYLNDWLFWLEVTHSLRCAVMEETLYNYRIHGSNTTFRKGWIEDSALAYSIVEEFFRKDLTRGERSMLLYLRGLALLKLDRYFEGRQSLLGALELNPFSPGTLKIASAFLFSLLGRRGTRALNIYGRIVGGKEGRTTIQEIKRKHGSEG